MSERPRSHRFLQNAGWTLFRQGATLVMSFFLTPVLVHGLGTDGYALYSLIGVILGALAPLALGAGGAAARLIAEAAPKGDGRRVRDVFRHALIFHAVGPGLAAAALAAGAAWAPLFFSVPPELAASSVALFRWVALGAVGFILGQAGICVLVGLGRFDQVSLIESTLALALLGGSACLVRMGHGLAGIGPWFAAANAGYAAWALATAWRSLQSRASVSGPSTHPLAAREFATSALPFFLINILGVLSFQMDKVFIASMLPLSSLTFYMIPFSIAQRLETIPRSISVAAFQMSGELSGLGQIDSLRRLYLKCTKLIALALIPAVVLLFAFAPQFLTLWLGAEFSDRGTWPFRVVLAGFSFYFLALTPLWISQGIGRGYVAVAAYGSTAGLSFLFWALFIPRYGVPAAAGGFLAAQAISAAGLVLYFHRSVLRVGLSEYFSESLKTPLISGAFLLLAALLVHPDANTWPRLVLAVATGCGISFGVSLLLLDPQEKDMLRLILRRSRSPEPTAP